VTGPSAAPPAPLAADLAVPVALAAAALSLTYVLAVWTRAGQALDTHAMVLTAQYLAGAGWTDGLLDLISPGSVALALVVLGGLVWVLDGAVTAVAATATAVGTILGAAALKALLIRPALLDDAANSLPSGHVAAVAGLAAGAALAASRSTRTLVVIAGVAAVAVTGLATSALEWHRPSDVLASALLAVLMAATAHASLRIRGSRPSVADTTHPAGVCPTLATGGTRALAAASSRADVRRSASRTAVRVGAQALPTVRPAASTNASSAGRTHEGQPGVQP